MSSPVKSSEFIDSVTKHYSIPNITVNSACSQRLESGSVLDPLFFTPLTSDPHPPKNVDSEADL